MVASVVLTTILLLTKVCPYAMKLVYAQTEEK